MRSPRRSCRFTRQFPPTPPSGKRQPSLRWARIKPPKGCSGSRKIKEATALPGGLVRVKVSGVLKAEGAIVGNFIKDGRYTVSGEQHYDPKSREWKKAKWSVDVSQRAGKRRRGDGCAGEGQMRVESKAVGETPPVVDAKEPRATQTDVPPCDVASAACGPTPSEHPTHHPGPQIRYGRFSLTIFASSPRRLLTSHPTQCI